MNANVYRQMIADGHTLTAQDALTLCDEVDALQRVNRILDDAAKDAQHYAYQLQEARAELARLRSAPVAVEAPEIPEWDDVNAKLLRNGWDSLNPLEKFIHHNEPAIDDEDGDGADSVFRNGLLEAIKFSVKQIHPSRILKDGEEPTRWISVEDALPEDGERVGFIVDCKRDDFMHGRVYGGKFIRRDWDERWGGFNTHGLGACASHWCRLPPVPDDLRSNKEGAA